MDISDSLLCMFSAEVEQVNRRYVLQIPEQEIEVGQLQEGDSYRVALLPSVKPEQDEAPVKETDQNQSRQTSRQQTGQQPPVEEGDIREVEIEDLGEKGDGLARIGPGYIVFVPDTDIGDRVKVEITEARENFAFAEVVDTTATV